MREEEDDIDDLDEDEEEEAPPQHQVTPMRLLRYGVAALGIAALILAAKIYYPHARDTHLIRMARVFIKNNEFRQASLCVRRALVSDERNLDAILLMAELSELSNSPQSLFWRKRAVEIEPQHLRYKVDFIKAALKQGETALAAEALATIDEAGRRTAAYHHLAASIAIAWKQIAQAEAHASKALELEPANEGYQFNVGLIWMQLADETRQSKGVELVRALSEHSDFRFRALRALVADAAARGDLKQAIEFSTDLQLEVQSTLADRTLHLDLLQKANDSAAREFLDGLRVTVAKDSEAVLTVVMWMLQRNRAAEALAWVNSLPAASLTEPPIRMAIAECHAAARNWDALRAYLSAGEWRGVEFLRNSYFARLHRAQGNDDLFHDSWDDAVRLAARKTGPLSLLNRLAAQWGWARESDDLLWDVAGGQFNNVWALEALYKKYEAAGDARSLYQVILRMLELKPSDIVAQNNFALLSLLLNVRTDQAMETARDLYSRHSGSPVILTTYAYSLVAQNKVQAALNLFTALGSEQLADPNVAAYYSIALHAAGKPDEAKKYAHLASAARLLPEERALLQKVL
jgi:hypothetical protein